jgi:hypothetical protein
VLPLAAALAAAPSPASEPPPEPPPVPPPEPPPVPPPSAPAPASTASHLPTLAPDATPAPTLALLSIQAPDPMLSLSPEFVERMREQMRLADVTRTQRLSSQADLAPAPLQEPPARLPSPPPAIVPPTMAALAGSLPLEDDASSVGGVLTCSICFTGSKDHLAVPCGHQFACASCAERIQRKGQPCPMCRSPIEKFVQVRIC